MEKKNYSGYFCKKCNSIPLIQIIPKENNSKILSSCKCRKHYQTIDNFIKCNYHKDIDINKITDNKFFENKDSKDDETIYIPFITEQLNKNWKKMKKEADKIKNKIIELFQRKIDEVNKLYKSYIENNNKIILVLEELIKSYQLIEDNHSNILNIINNFSFKELYTTDKTFFINQSLDGIFKKVKNYFDSEFIINASNLIKKDKNKFVKHGSNNLACFLELDNSICASCSNWDDSICLYDLNNLNDNNIYFKAHSKVVNWLIKSNKNNIISCGNDDLIKIWPIITESYINQQKKLYNLNNNMNNKYLYSFYKKMRLDLIPIYEFKLDNSQLTHVMKMIHLKENKFLLFTDYNIFIFKYIIDENKIIIDLIENYKTNNLIDAITILKKNDEIIGAYNNTSLFFLNIPDLKFINKINIKLMAGNSLMQLSTNDLLLADRYSFKIIDINNFKIKLIIKYPYNTEFLLNLNDGTIIQGTFFGVKRLLIRTLEELPDLVEYEKDEDANYTEKIINMYKLKNGKLVLCHENGKVEIYNLFI